MRFMKKSMVAVVACTALLTLAVTDCSHKNVSDNLTPVEAQDLAREIYIYGYPLVLAGTTRDVLTSTSKATETRAPYNQFFRRRSFPTPKDLAVVSPNADTLYSSAWLDLTDEPMVLNLPDSKGRYYLVQVMDAWTNVIASPGTRTSGNKPGSFAIVGPNYTGSVPSNIQQIKSPTNHVWLIGRAQTNGVKDYAKVREFQSQLRLTPLQYLGSKYTPPTNVPIAKKVDGRTRPMTQVENMDAETFYTALADNMIKNPPRASDSTMVKNMKRLGINPGEPLRYADLPPATQNALESGIVMGNQQLEVAANSLNGDVINGWRFPGVIGTYDNNYLDRAVIARNALGANLKEDAIYPRATTDQTGQQLNGRNKYTMHFEKDDLPPVNAFWSLTMYNQQLSFVPNSIHRYAIGDRDKMKYNSDGSLDLFIQSSNPGGAKVSNWLPAPAGDFNLLMRLYWPRQAALDGRWKIPGVQKSNGPSMWPQANLK